jgi:Tfp pilus assembly protein PilN
MYADTHPKGNLKFHDPLITADSVQAMGTCDSFAIVSDWERRLQQVPGFSAVDIQNQKKDAGQVQFTLSISSSGMER